MRHIAFTLLFVFFPPCADAAQSSPRKQPVEFTGRVVAVADGDTLTILTSEKRQIRIRLAEIDARELRQPFGTKAKAIRSNLCFGKMVTAVQLDRDRYGRIVGRVGDGAVDINAEMIRRGAAWVDRRYLKDKSLLELEAAAGKNARRLWALPENQRVPPWEWRRRSSRAQLQTWRTSFAISLW
jgi:endonuclease YncB( thermonuclease family)